MEDIDTREISKDDGISDEEDVMRDVIQGDADLFYLHCCLSEIFQRGDNF